MQGSEIVFQDTFKKELEPLFLDLGFSILSLPEGWIQPTFLYKHHARNIWFGCSWDWRDFYFEADLGRLYKFRDVLPRVVVCGLSLVHNLESASTSQYIAEQFVNVKNRLLALTNSNFEIYNIEITEAHNTETQRLKSFLEDEITSEADLPFIKAPRSN